MDAKERIIEQRSEKRRRSALVMKSIIALLILLVVVLLTVLIKVGWSEGLFSEAALHVADMMGLDTSLIDGSDQEGPLFPGHDGEDGDEDELSDGDPVLEKAKLLAAQYDYTAAVELLKKSRGYRTRESYQEAAADYQLKSDSCRAFPLEEVTHVFFHTLIVDTQKAFDGDEDQDGYNQVMTTVDECNRILEEMYARGYVMVSPHDMCEVHKDGSVTAKEILLPEEKKAFVLSQDDVSYYHYMDGDGFASSLIVDEDGRVRNTYPEDDGSVSVGAYDLVPIVDDFVQEHPDFSYHGHKGVIALTGYEGVLGYRTDEVYKTREESDLTEYQQAFFEANPDFNWKKEVKKAKAVAAAMKEDGWEFASHTWGHINPLETGYEGTVQDTEKWLKNVETIVGKTDILIFAFGADINSWGPYTHENEYFSYLKKKGFSIYCNVDGSQKAWVQFGDDYMRQGRRNLDGYRMYYNPELLDDLMDVDYVWDASRPEPVPPMGGESTSYSGSDGEGDNREQDWDEEAGGSQDGNAEDWNQDDNAEEWNEEGSWDQNDNEGNWDEGGDWSQYDNGENWDYQEGQDVVIYE